MKTLVLGLAGRARNGKTTASDAVKAHAEAVGLTAGVYDIGLTILKHCQGAGLIPRELTREQLSPAQVEILVKEGQRMRGFDANHWVNMIDLGIKADGFDVALIPNIRFMSEVDMVKKASGFIIRVDALNADGSPFISRDRDPNDISETTFLQINPDYFITARKGEGALVGEMAITIFEYIRGQREA